MTENNDKDTLAAKAHESEKNGRLAGAGAGVIAGAQLGTVLLPIPIIGTFTGGLLGGLLGARVGKKVAATVEEKVTATHSQPSDIGKELERLARLRDQGILSEEEFKAAKAKVLGF